MVVRLVGKLVVAGTLTGCSLAFPVHESDGTPSDAGPSVDASVAEAGASEAGAPYVAEVRADAPSLYVRLGESAGPRAVDAAGSHDGTYGTGGLAYGMAGALRGDPDTAVAFDGSGAVTLPAGFDFASVTPFTVEIWTNQTAYASFGFVVDHEEYATQGGGRRGWDLLSNATEVVFERYGGSATPSALVSSHAPMSLGGYHHVVVTFDGGTLRLYIDASLRGSTVTSEPLPASTAPWTLGGQHCDCTVNDFRGTLDEFALYGAALGPERVAAHYHAAGR